MTIKERELLLKINRAVIKASQPPPTTFAPQTGNVTTQPEYQPALTPLPITTQTQT
jgi:hypothetical protein